MTQEKKYSEREYSDIAAKLRGEGKGNSDIAAILHNKGYKKLDGGVKNGAAISVLIQKYHWNARMKRPYRHATSKKDPVVVGVNAVPSAKKRMDESETLALLKLVRGSNLRNKDRIVGSILDSME